jgi:hypothetical protein
MPDVRQVSFRRVGRPGNGGAGGEQISPESDQPGQRIRGPSETVAPAVSRFRPYASPLAGRAAIGGASAGVRSLPRRQSHSSQFRAKGRACRGSAQQAGDGLRERPDA